MDPTVGTAARPSSRQVGFAEKLARRKRTHVPDECFRSRDLMSRWIVLRDKPVRRAISRIGISSRNAQHRIT